MLLSFPDSLSGLFFALLGVYLFFASSAINLHFFLGVFFHFIIGADTNSDAMYDIEDSTLPPKVFAVVERPDHAILDLNRMCHAIRPMDMAEMEKLEAVVLMTRAESASEVRQLAENLDRFDFMPKPDSPAADSALTELGYVAYHGNLTLGSLMGAPREPSRRRITWGEEPQRNERVLSEGQDERYEACGDEMRDDPAEQCQEMGGMA